MDRELIFIDSAIKSAEIVSDKSVGVSAGGFHVTLITDADGRSVSSKEINEAVASEILKDIDLECILKRARTSALTKLNEERERVVSRENNSKHSS